VRFCEKFQASFNIFPEKHGQMLEEAFFLSEVRQKALGNNTTRQETAHTQQQSAVTTINKLRN